MTTIVVYAGGFQPFHTGHMSSYVQAKHAFPGADFFVAASNDTKTRPIPFADKQFLAKQAGVKDPFVQVKSPIAPKEILEQYNPDQDIFVLIRSERDPVNYTKKDGSPGYFQPFKSIDKCEPFSKHAYIFVTKKHVFDIGGVEIYSGSQVRSLYAKTNDAGKAELINGLYPKSPAKQKIKQLLDKYLSLQESIKYLQSRVLKEGTLEQKLRMQMIVNDLNEGWKSKVAAGAAGYHTNNGTVFAPKLAESYTVGDFKIRCFESWLEYCRFLRSPKDSTRDTAKAWPLGVAAFLSPNKTALLSESTLTQNDRATAKKFSDAFKALDKRDMVKIKVGNSLSVLYTIIDLDRKEVELGGFVNPKTITNINLDQSGSVDTITFEDGSQFPERNELTNVGGQNITNTIFFPNRTSASSAYTNIWMRMNSLESQDWSINNQSLTENNEEVVSTPIKPFSQVKQHPLNDLL